jgi:hypothetical protein
VGPQKVVSPPRTQTESATSWEDTTQPGEKGHPVVDPVLETGIVACLGRAIRIVPGSLRF